MKLKSRNNLIAKLTGTSCGASASTLHTSALALCYSVAEYCCPVWLDPATEISPTPNFIIQCALFQAACNPRSSHGCQCSAMLHLLLYIVKQQLTICFKSSKPGQLYADVFQHPPPRLASRRPIWSDMTSVDTITQWR